MRQTMRALARTLTVAAVVACGLFWSGQLPTGERTALVSTAHAIIGRPLTPMSYAGVARRTTRRAYGYGVPAYAAPRPVVVAPAPVVVAPAPVAAPRCVQVVDAYGRLTYRCR